MVSPGAYKRRVLVAACGMSPQIVTETLYALRVAAPERFAVNEIRIVTTLAGRDQAVNALLVGGKLRDLCEEHGFDDIRFDAQCITVIQDSAGKLLQDIQTPADNEHAADCITEEIRSLTSCPDTALHVSLAGGRKTMGYYIGYALSLFGRAQDRLSHVLVDEGFESNREFFFPTRTSRMIETRDGRFLDASKACVTLAEIPFVRLRDTLPPRIRSARASFSEAVRWSNLDQDPTRLEIDLATGSVRASGQPVRLSRLELAMYAAFARAAKEGEPEFEGKDSNLPLTRAFLEELARCAGVAAPAGRLDGLMEQLDDAGIDVRTLGALRDGQGRISIGGKYLQPKVSGINKKLGSALGARLSAPYRIQVRERVKAGNRKVPMYSTGLKPSEIVIDG
jgi:CRISPR-associated protein (TIGR02584 family)